MGKWNQTVDVKAILKDYKGVADIETLKEMGTKIATLLKAKLDKYINSESDDWDPSFEEVHDRFKDFDFDDVDEFDNVLNDMYDLFDHYRIWSGL